MNSDCHHGTPERGPPPCQRLECERSAHFRTGYVHCSKHDPVDVPPFAVESEPTGIATNGFRFFFGASCGSSRKTLRQLQEPNVMLSYGTRDREPWAEIETLMIDSGGYSLIEKGGGEYPDEIADYLEFVERSGAAYYVTRDVPTADSVLQTLDRGVSEAIARTVELTLETLEQARERDLNAEPVAVLQGTTPQEYVSCYHELVAADAVTGRLAIGSLKPHTTAEVVDIVTTVREAIDADTETPSEIELHGLGVDVPTLEHPSVRRALSSADSSRYISTARWRANREETPPRLRDDEPRTGWYEVLRAYLDMREELRLALDPDRASRRNSVAAVESRTTQTTIEEVTP